MFGTQINRYIIREILSPTLLCLVIFTMVMLLGRAFTLADLIINKGVALTDILALLTTLLPTFFAITLPLAFILGIMIGLGRMSADSEMVALKAAGIGLGQIARPVFLMAVVFMLLTGATTLWLKPLGNRAFAYKSFEIARQKMTIGFQPRLFMNQFNDLVIYANEIDDRSGLMFGLFIVEKKPKSTAWVFADSGKLVTDESSETVTIRLHNGVIHRQPSGSPDNYQLINFSNYDIQPEVAIREASANKKDKPRVIPTARLWSKLSTGESASKDQELKAELNFRLAAPLAPLLFVLFGLPFSIQSHRSGRSGGFVMGLLIFLVYQFMLSMAYTITSDAATPPWLAFWLPHFTLAVTGCFFLYHAAQERANPLILWIDQTLLTWQKRSRKNVDS